MTNQPNNNKSNQNIKEILANHPVWVIVGMIIAILGAVPAILEITQNTIIPKETLKKLEQKEQCFDELNSNSFDFSKSREKCKYISTNPPLANSSSNTPEPNAIVASPESQLTRYYNMLTLRNWVEAKKIRPELNQAEAEAWLKKRGVKTIELVKVIQEEEISSEEQIITASVRYNFSDNESTEEVRQYTFIKQNSQWIFSAMSGILRE